MTRLLPLLLLLAGCPAHVYSSALASGQDGQTLWQTKQPCQQSEAAVRAVDVVLPIALNLYRERGYCEKYIAGTKVFVCIIDQPEQCDSTMPWPRHGCASIYHIQQSIRWPPLCDRWPGIPDSLKCVRNEAEQRLGWERNFVHEVTNLVLQRCGITDPSYVHEARKLGPEIWRRYQAAKGGDT